MTKQENEFWQSIAESGGDGWTEDTIFRLTGRGALYHCGDSDGRYISAGNNGLLSVGSFSEAFPHMGMAFFTPEWSKQYAGFNKAIEAAHELTGSDFWDEVYSPDIGVYAGLPTAADAQPEAFLTNFYCPLTVKMKDDEGSEYVETDVGILGYYEDKIRDFIEADLKRGGADLAEYFHGSPELQDKLLSVRFDVENVRNEIFGCIHVNTTEQLTGEEKKEIRDYCIGQASDGFGEGLEQRPFKSDDGDLYISFWDSDEDWFMLDEDEFERHLGGQFMGGIE